MLTKSECSLQDRAAQARVELQRLITSGEAEACRARRLDFSGGQTVALGRTSERWSEVVQRVGRAIAPQNLPPSPALTHCSRRRTSIPRRPEPSGLPRRGPPGANKSAPLRPGCATHGEPPAMTADQVRRLYEQNPKSASTWCS